MISGAGSPSRSRSAAIDGDPGLVGLRRGRRRLAPGDHVGLLDERGRKAELPRLELGADEIRRPHPATGAMAEYEQALRVLRLFQVSPRGAVRSLDLDRVHDAGR